MFLSIVIPAYNEEPRIGDTLERVITFLAAQPYTWEVVVADDGSTDGTSRVVTALSDRYANLRLLRLPHRGKGSAVKQGMLAATGEYRVLCDADLSVPIEHVERLLPPMSQDVDIAVGSREAPGARRIGEPASRHLLGRIYNFVVRFLAVPGFRDTQCGFKCFRGDIVPELFGRQTMDGFAFDVEILFLARKAGLRMSEIGVDWHYHSGSKVHPLRDSLPMTRDLLRLRWNYLRGQYR